MQQGCLDVSKAISNDKKEVKTKTGKQAKGEKWLQQQSMIYLHVL